MMQLRSGRRVVSPPPAPPRGDLRRGRPRRIVPGGNDDDGEDRISGLPDELLLDVLRRLGCARQAARTGVLSRRWRGLWTELRELSFQCVGANALETALARVDPKLNHLGFSVSSNDGSFTSARISSLLRAADRFAPAALAVNLGELTVDDSSPFELPCFGSATTSIDLLVSRRGFTLAPAAGDFARLEQLALTFERCRVVVDLSVLLPRCPRLRRLSMCSVCPLDSSSTNTIAVESASLEELMFYMINGPADVVIVAPELKKFNVAFEIDDQFTVSHSAPKLEEFHLKYTCAYSCAGFGDKWRLRRLRMETQWSVDGNGNHALVRVHVLSLTIFPTLHPSPVERTFAQEVARLPVNHFSVLELTITPLGHVFAPLLLHLLLIRTSIQRLKLVLITNDFPECSENCDCDQDGNWRNEQISLPDLQDVEIQGFNTADHEVDFLHLLFRSAPNLKRMKVKLSEEDSQGDGGCLKLCSIFEANTSVKCNVYDESGDMIPFA